MPKVLDSRAYRIRGPAAAGRMGYGGTLQLATPPGGGAQLTWTALVHSRMAR